MAISFGLCSEPAAYLDLGWLDRLAADGVDTLQIREKHLGDDDLLRLVRRVADHCADSSLRVLVNGRADIAALAGADGVHLPSRGAPTAAVRRQFPDLLVGRSTHRLDEVRQAARDGAHYMTFSPIRATPSKKGYGPPQGFDRLRDAVATVEETGTATAVLALGGLDADDVTAVRDTGAHGLAGIRVFLDDRERGRLVDAWRTDSDGTRS